MTGADEQEPSLGRGEWSVAAMFCVSVRGVSDRHFGDAADRGRHDFVESSFGYTLVKQQELFLVWRLKDCCPPFEVSSCHRRGAPFARRTASLSSLD